MDNTYVVGFKDVYPWVWSVMLGVSLTLADKRGAFTSSGTHTPWEFWAKNVTAVLLNLILPATFFGLTMVRIGPLYPRDMGFWQILGTLYFAGLPLGSHHVWLVVALRRGWTPPDLLPQPELARGGKVTRASLIWVGLAFAIPVGAAISGWRLPW